MGGSSKKQTVGYKYYLGMHLVLCHGPIDLITSIEVGERVAWRGFTKGGRINISSEDLFGGEKREGGISGAVDIDMGSPSQGQNSYLAARLGSNLPAFRGVVSAVLRQVYLGMNPYLKPWAFRAQRIYVRSGGEPQWYGNKAAIGFVSDVALYIAIDDSGSMLIMSSNGKTRLQNMKEALDAALSPLRGLPANSSVDIMVVSFGNTRYSRMYRGASGDDVVALIDWIYARTGGGSATDFNQAVAEAPGFFAGAGQKKRVSIFLTDGEPNPTNSHLTAGPTLLGISGIEAYGINIDLEDTTATAYLDNTSGDGVPVAQSGDGTSIQRAVMNGIFAHFDMNPAHILRECLTDTVWGMGYPESDLDEQTFIDSADQLFNESLGLSILWDRQIPLEEFVQEILKHIDGVLRVNRRTGKFELKLVRDDYELGDLLELNPSNVQKVEGFSRPSFGELVNSVSVNYWDAMTGDPASLSVQDIALIATQGSTINTTVQYPGVSNQSIAARLASRDLKTLSNPLISCTLYTNQEAKDLNVGDVFKLTWPDYMVDEMPLRVTSIAYGNGRSNRIKIQAVQDIFGLPESVMPEDSGEGWTDPAQPPVPAENRLLVEATYFELLLQMGHTQITQELTDVPELGYFRTTAGRPDDGAVNAQLRVDSGAGYEDAGVVDFCPTGELSAPLGKFVDTITLENVKDGDLVEPGTRAYIGDEMVAVTSFNFATGELVVVRGILDTVPVEHPAGTVVYFAELYLDGDETEYVDGDTIKVKLLPVTGEGVLDVTSATADSIKLDARAVRPFRPANLTAAGFIDPDPDFYPDYPVIVKWVGRNRLQETTTTYLSWTDAGVAPEPGTDYRVLVEAIDDNGAVAGQVNQVTTAGALSYTLKESTVGATWAAYPFMRVTVTAFRDGRDCWQSPSVMFRGPLREPTELAAVYCDPYAPDGLSAQNAP